MQSVGSVISMSFEGVGTLPATPCSTAEKLAGIDTPSSELFSCAISGEIDAFYA